MSQISHKFTNNYLEQTAKPDLNDGIILTQWSQVLLLLVTASFLLQEG